MSSLLLVSARSFKTVPEPHPCFHIQPLLDWTLRGQGLTLDELLVTDWRALFESVFPGIRGAEVFIEVSARPDPQSERAFSQFTPPCFAVQGDGSVWGSVSFSGSLPTYCRSLDSSRKLSAECIRIFTSSIAQTLDAALERKRIKQSLEAINQQAAAVVHEVRNPLTALRLQMHLLEVTLARATHAQSNAYITKLLKDMDSEAQRITSHLEDLSTLAQFNAGKFSLHPTRVDLVSSLRAVVGRFSRLFELKGTSCELVAQDEQIIGHWDAFRIEQVVGNLLSNAWKYGDSKPVQVYVDPMTPGCCESSDSCCVIRIKDQGPGISNETQKRIFDGFVRGEGAGRQRGTGLGLYVCANLIQAMGGSITLKSRIGEGSEFIICIPRKLELNVVSS